MLFSKEQVGWILKNVCFSFTKEEKIEEQKEEDKLLERQKQEDGPINVRCCHLITDTRSANVRAHTHTHTVNTQTEVCILLCVPTQAPPYLIAAYHVYTSTSATAHTHTHTSKRTQTDVYTAMCAYTSTSLFDRCLPCIHIRYSTHTHTRRYNNRECCNRYNEFSHFWDGCVRKCEELNIIQCVTKVNMSNMLV